MVPRVELESMVRVCGDVHASHDCELLSRASSKGPVADHMQTV